MSITSYFYKLFYRQKTFKFSHLYIQFRSNGREFVQLSTLFSLYLISVFLTKRITVLQYLIKKRIHFLSFYHSSSSSSSSFSCILFISFISSTRSHLYDNIIPYRFHYTEWNQNSSLFISFQIFALQISCWLFQNGAVFALALEKENIRKKFSVKFRAKYMVKFKVYL